MLSNRDTPKTVQTVRIRFASLLARIIRFQDAPRYLGMDRNRFNAEVRPHVAEIPIGKDGIGFDRHDLDAWADEYKRRNGRPAPIAGQKSPANEYPASSRRPEAGLSTSSSLDGEFGEGLAQIRERVAAEHGIQLYARYSERHAADRIGWNYSTLKRKRRAGMVPFVDLGDGSIGYLGIHIVDIIALGVKAKQGQPQPATYGSSPCRNTHVELSSSESGSSTSGPVLLPTTAQGTTAPPASSSALALARLALKRPKQD